VGGGVRRVSQRDAHFRLEPGERKCRRRAPDPHAGGLLVVRAWPGSGANVIKLFTAVTNGQKYRLFIPGRLLKLSLKFVSKYSNLHVISTFLALPANIRLGWKGLPGRPDTQRSDIQHNDTQLQHNNK